MISQLSLPTSRTGADWAKSCRHRRNQRKHFCERSNNAGAGNYDAPAFDYICLVLKQRFPEWLKPLAGPCLCLHSYLFPIRSKIQVQPPLSQQSIKQRTSRAFHLAAEKNTNLLPFNCLQLSPAPENCRFLRATIVVLKSDRSCSPWITR